MVSLIMDRITNTWGGGARRRKIIHESLSPHVSTDGSHAPLKMRSDHSISLQKDPLWANQQSTVKTKRFSFSHRKLWTHWSPEAFKRPLCWLARSVRSGRLTSRHDSERSSRCLQSPLSPTDPVLVSQRGTISGLLVYRAGQSACSSYPTALRSPPALPGIVSGLTRLAFEKMEAEFLSWSRRMQQKFLPTNMPVSGYQWFVRCPNWGATPLKLLINFVREALPYRYAHAPLHDPNWFPDVQNIPFATDPIRWSAIVSSTLRDENWRRPDLSLAQDKAEMCLTLSAVWLRRRTWIETHCEIFLC